ncbi:DUF3800 domain-containing protein [Achromobacter xylosoxidans]
MSRAMQIDELRMGMPALRNWDASIDIFYDETNNIRRLTLNELGLNVTDNKAFVIGGVALRAGAEISEWSEFRQLLRVQPSAPEIKFEHVAKGGYEDVLKSQKLALFLQWLIDRKMMIHYSALDPLYWAILDIIESLQADERFLEINAFHMELKTELHHAVTQDLSGFLTLMHSYGYPNVPRVKVQPFMKAVGTFVAEHVPLDRSEATAVLKSVLGRAARLTDLELVFLHDNNPGELIDNFSHHFLHCVYIFKNASHVFDEETFVEKALESVDLYEGERRLDYRFADSKTEPGIQLSDVIAGLTGRYFGYLQDHSLSALMQRKAGFTELQLENLNRFRTLIDGSDAFSDGLFHRLMPFDTHFKDAAFLHEVTVPQFMWNA